MEIGETTRVEGEDLVGKYGRMRGSRVVGKGGKGMVNSGFDWYLTRVGFNIKRGWVWFVVWAWE